MSRVHIFGVEGDVERWAPLAELLESDGLRFGWLDLSDVDPPAQLARAAELGALRAVAAGAGGVVAVKSARSRLVLRDIFREHFRGCDVVLVRGLARAKQLEIDDGRWLVRSVEGTAENLDSKALLARLRKPGTPSREI